MIFKLTVLRWKWGTLLALLFLGSLVACGDAASPEIDLTGTWEGSTVELNPLRLSLNLIDAGGEISGGGTLTWGGFNPITIERVTGSRSKKQ